MKRTDEGVFLTHDEARVIGASLEYATTLVREPLHNFAVELDGRPGLFPDDHVARDKGNICIDYRVTEEEVIDNITVANNILNGDIDVVKSIFKSTTCGALYDALNEFKDIFHI